jgi:hypothetical protein
MDGNAALKSNRTIAPPVRSRAICIAAASIAMRFDRIERPGKKPYWFCDIQSHNTFSQRNLAAFATSRLSVLTIESGRVAFGL